MQVWKIHPLVQEILECRYEDAERQGDPHQNGPGWMGVSGLYSNVIPNFQTCPLPSSLVLVRCLSSCLHPSVCREDRYDVLKSIRIFSIGLNFQKMGLKELISGFKWERGIY